MGWYSLCPKTKIKCDTQPDYMPHGPTLRPLALTAERCLPTACLPPNGLLEIASQWTSMPTRGTGVFFSGRKKILQPPIRRQDLHQLFIVSCTIELNRAVNSNSTLYSVYYNQHCHVIARRSVLMFTGPILELSHLGPPQLGHAAAAVPVSGSCHSFIGSARI